MAHSGGASTEGARTGGEWVADALVAQGVRHLFTLCGGHVAPILVAAKARGIRVIDTRDERSAAFAADAVSRLTGIPGVAVVTAGPGVTNTITAVKNAQLAQSPLVILGGATGTILEGRGSLQDIDQRALLEPHVKFLARVRRVRDLAPAVHGAFAAARSGVPGPAFVECPVDLLYEESVVRGLYGVGDGTGDGTPPARPARSLGARLLEGYLRHHVDGLFRGADRGTVEAPVPARPNLAEARAVAKVERALASATRPVLLVGSQAMLDAAGEGSRDAAPGAVLAAAVGGLGMPVYLSGMARGLLGSDHPHQMRHQRRKALAEADLVLLAGVPCDFRLDYGRHLPGRATVVSVNLSGEDLKKNRRPQIGVRAAPGAFLVQLGERSTGGTEPWDTARWADWRRRLAERDQAREADIDRRAGLGGDPGSADETGPAHEPRFVNPLAFFRALDPLLDDNSVLVADGGDFVATASYTLRPRGPLRWLDPGVFGTLGVGGGFAVGAQAVLPDAEVWLIWGDGSSAFSLAELDTCTRHGLPVIAIVGNDASWAQIAREQVEMLGDACGTELARTDYHRVAEGYGAHGLLLERIEDATAVLSEAKRVAKTGKPVLVNVLLAGTDFRKGSISM